MLGVPPSLSSESLFELFPFFIDIFQKLAAVKDQREWVTTSGAHKVSGPGKPTLSSTWQWLTLRGVQSPVVKFYVIITQIC